MAILLTGSLGKTTSHLAAILHSQNESILIASRTGRADPYPAIRFDWNDERTWENIFVKGGREITTAYLIGPPSSSTETGELVKRFIDFARVRGVKRFVFLSSSAVDEGSASWYGDVHRYLKMLGERDGVEWTVLRPSWFMQNFSTHPSTHPIKSESRIVSATGTGRLPWVDASDIAAVAARALTDETAHNTDHLVLGPELLSYGDIATHLSTILKRTITHTSLSSEAFQEYLISKSLPPAGAGLLALLDQGIAAGSKGIEGKSEEKLGDTVLKVTGRPPTSFKTWAERELEGAVKGGLW